MARRLFARLSLGLVLLVGGGCTSIPVYTDHDETADFSGLRTYRILEDLDRRTDPNFPQFNSLLFERTVRIIDRSLAERGYHPAPSGDDADFWIRYAYGLSTRREFYDVGGFTAYHRPFGTGFVSSVVTRCTLVLDVVPPDTDLLIWTGAATLEISRDGPTKGWVEQVVRAIVEEFPPDSEPAARPERSE